MKPETKEKLINILNITTWCLLISGLFVCLGFVDKTQDSLVCKDIVININDDDEVFFVQQEDIRQMLKSRGDAIINEPVRNINIPEIERVVNTHAAVESAEIYMDVNGGLNIDIRQRKPLIRIIADSNETYYIDTAGKLMLLSDNYAARVIVANGNISEPYAKRYMFTMADIQKRPGLRDSTVLDDLFELAKYINKDPFWKAQVQQLYVNDNKEFEIIPRVGEHVILLGDASDMDEKFKKLMTFYQEGMNSTGRWNDYSLINLKYKNQVVCTRKEEVTNTELYAKNEKNPGTQKPEIRSEEKEIFFEEKKERKSKAKKIKETETASQKEKSVKKKKRKKKKSK